MTTFRAAYYVPPDCSSSVLLTAPDDARLSDDQLKGKALAEASFAGLMGTEPHMLTHDEFLAGLCVGEWTE